MKPRNLFSKSMQQLFTFTDVMVFNSAFSFHPVSVHSTSDSTPYITVRSLDEAACRLHAVQIYSRCKQLAKLVLENM